MTCGKFKYRITFGKFKTGITCGKISAQHESLNILIETLSFGNVCAINRISNINTTSELYVIKLNCMTTTSVPIFAHRWTRNTKLNEPTLGKGRDLLISLVPSFIRCRNMGTSVHLS